MTLTKATYSMINGAPANVLDYGAVADGAFTPGGSASGTDNLAAFQAALSYCESSGVDLFVPAGEYYFSSGITIPSGVRMFGEGQQFVPFFLGENSSPKTGTSLLINGQIGDDCVKYAESGFNTVLESLSVFNVNTNAIRAVVRIAGQLYPSIRKVSVNSLRPTTGAGLLLETADIGGTYYETLYAEVEHVECTTYNPGGATEASCHTGLKIVSRSAGKRVNAVRFYSGSFSGKVYAFDISSLVANTGAINMSFHGTLFEGSYDSGMDHVFVPDSLRLIDYIATSSYVVKLGRIIDAETPNFNGCYFEMGGVPATYNDGVNGVAPLVAAVWVDNNTGVKEAVFDACSFNSAYVYDNGFRTQITPTASGYRYDNTRATSLTVRKNASQTIPSVTWTKVEFGSSPFRGGDNFLVWDSANNQAVFRSPGTYLITANLVFTPGWVTAGKHCQCRVSVGGNQFNGSIGIPAATTAAPISTSISIPIDFVVGDVTYVEVFQNEGAGQDLSASGSNCWFTVTKIA